MEFTGAAIKNVPSNNGTIRFVLYNFIKKWKFFLNGILIETRFSLMQKKYIR